MVSDRVPAVERVNRYPINRLSDQHETEVMAENNILRQLDSAAPKRHQLEQMQRFAGLGIGLSSVFAENLLSHPCITLRRQCQVHHDSEWYHLTPFTMFTVIYTLQRNQSPATLWKGIGSVFVVKGISLVSEAAISEFTPFPREVTRHTSLKKLGQHIILKGLTYLITTPFFAASLIETVQSEIASERPGVLDCVKEGFSRLCGFGVAQTTRLLPIWKLLIPSVMYGLGHYMIKSVAQYTMMTFLHNEMKEDSDRGDSEPVKSMYDRYFPELLATFSGSICADVMLYPLETVVHRLHVQGTRTIIDNTDIGLGVIPINTSYEGAIDCFKSILINEGMLGFYKGFGALVIQYTLHVVILKLTKFLFELLTDEFEPRADDSNRSDNRKINRTPVQ
ncbi:mitochondrial outer membrane protein SLC25A46-like [Tubulanus polymorphus]|uniref:mitochondrial outer membrane protein SLC25A46-like n=1 Tax=Tubulanus polymorphus TaxID=672921 RepID=UPI003DA33591